MGGQKSKKFGGLLSLFDWKKSGKKLLSNHEILIESTDGEQLRDNFTAAGQALCEEEGTAEVTSLKGSGRTLEVISSKGNGDVSSFLLMKDEENLVKGPGVVARLMGLESMPNDSELNFTLYHDSQCFQGDGVENGGSHFYINDKFNDMTGKGGGNSRRDTPSSSIDRFHMEMIPLKLVKSPPVPCHKLSSAKKNPIIIPQKLVFHSREEVAKCLDHPSQTNGILKSSFVEPSSISLRYKGSKEIVTTPAHVRPIKSHARPAESAAVTSLKEKPLNRSLNDSDDGIVCRSSRLMNHTSRYHAKVKGKESTSPARQDNANAQRADQLRRNNKKTLVRKGSDGCKVNQTLNCQKSRQLKSLSNDVPFVIKKNNLKQKKENFGPLSVSNLQGSRLQGRNLSSEKKTGNKLPASTNVGYSECSSVTTDNEEGEGFAVGYKSSPLKKGYIGKNSINVEKRSTVGNSEIDSYGKCVHNFILDEHSWWTKNSRKAGTDVVSFTFATPIVKPVLGHHIPSQVVERGEKNNEKSLDIAIRKNASCFTKTNHNVLNDIDGDALGVLLEQKLKELATRIKASNSSSVKASAVEPSVVLHGSVDYCCNAPNEHESLNCGSYENDLSGIFQFGDTPADGEVPGMRATVQQDIDESETSSCSSSGSLLDVQKEPHHQSPLSILEASSLSYESYDSSESFGSNKKFCFFQIHGQDIADITYTSSSPLAKALQLESSDSACSALGEVIYSITTHKKECHQEMEYVREILHSSGLTSDCIDLFHMARSGNTLNSLLFQKLECKERSVTHEEEYSSDCRLRRKLLFDCVSECLDMKFSLYCQAGYKAWSKGVAIIRKDLAEQLFEEICVWSMEDLMVDELINRDMSNQRGLWLDFEMEAFEAGEEIERGVLSSLVDELVADFLNDCSCLL